MLGAAQSDNALKYAWRPVEEAKTNKGVYKVAAKREYIHVNFAPTVLPTQVGGGGSCEGLVFTST